jgi:hypothetical protein
MSVYPYAAIHFFQFGEIKNILASLLTALEILSGMRHLLLISALLMARIVRYFQCPALLDIHVVYVKR